MKPFDQLTSRGQAKRLRKLVNKALDQYDLGVTEIHLVGLFTNAIFRLRLRGGHSCIMRVCRPGWRTESDLTSEINWLRALSRETDIRVPEPVPNRNGDFFVEVSVEGVPEPRRCVVLSWLPGTLLATRMNEKNLFKMGLLFARLHEHGASFVPPKDFTERKMDSIYARNEPDVLFNKSCHEAFTPNTRRILEETEERVGKAFAHVYSEPQGIQVIHNDLHHENIKIYHGKLFPLDFEDTIWGFPVQDIAMALQDLMGDVSRETYDPYQSAFREGYETIKMWPESYEGQIDTFRAGRMLWVANYVARYQRRHLRAHIDWLARQFNRYLDTGIIRKP